MTEPTTGERIILGDEVCKDGRRLRIQRTACKVFASQQAIQIRAIDAAIAEAVKAEREACAAIADEQQIEGECPERASYIAEAIRARSGQ